MSNCICIIEIVLELKKMLGFDVYFTSDSDWFIWEVPEYSIMFSNV